MDANIEISRVAIVGTGLIGSSWAARSGTAKRLQIHCPRKKSPSSAPRAQSTGIDKGYNNDTEFEITPNLHGQPVLFHFMRPGDVQPLSDSNGKRRSAPPVKG
jgi:hypothetical protein